MRKDEICNTHLVCIFNNNSSLQFSIWISTKASICLLHFYITLLLLQQFAVLILGVASQCHEVIYPSLSTVVLVTKRRKDGVQLIREPRKTNHCFTGRKRYFTGNLSYKVGHDIFGSVTIGSLIHVPHKEVKWTVNDQRNSWTNTSLFYVLWLFLKSLR